MHLPLLLHLRFPIERRTHGLWLPWLLVYPILLIIMLPVFPIILIIAAVLLPIGKARQLILAGPYLWQLLAVLGGLRVEIHTNRGEVLLNFV